MIATGRATALAVGLTLVAGPYFALIGGFTNKPGANEIWVRIVDSVTKRKEAMETGAVNGAPTTLFAAWYDPVKDPVISVWAATATASEVWQSMHYAPAVFAVIGLWAMRKRLLAEPETAVVAVLIAVNLGVMYVFAIHRGYLSGRHALLVVLLGCVLAGRGIEIVAEGLAGRVSYRMLCGLLLTALIGTSLPATLKTPHEHRAGHYFAGKYLETIGLKPGVDTVIDPFDWAMFYSGWSRTDIPPDAGPASVVYVVMEENTPSPHSRLPRYALAKSWKTNGVPVYHYPPDGPVSAAKVVVYRAEGAKFIARGVARSFHLR